MMSLIKIVTLIVLIGHVCCHPVEVFSEPEINDDLRLMGSTEEYEPELSNMVEEAQDFRDVTRDGLPTLSDIIESENADLDMNKKLPLITFGDVAVNPKARNADPCTATGCKWPKYSDGKVYVPVVISSRYSEKQKQVISNALQALQSTTCIRFVAWKEQQDYLFFLPRDGCWSYIGRQGGQQLVSLNIPGCVIHSTVQHEVLHALGFHHEQARSDRDNHVIILTDNIISGKERNFRKVATNNLRTPYDYGSVMHYGRYSFSNGNPTIVPKPNPNVSIGEARQMSRNDILRVNRLYNCRTF